MADGLYGKKKPAKIKGKEISSSNSIAFSSSLSSLIAKSTSKDVTRERTRPSNPKSDLFTAHRNTKKRAAKHIEDENGQAHQTRDDVGTVSAAELHRSKRRMEEKLRVYNAMKRGEYVGRDNGYDDRGLVDFDRKWAEKDYDKNDSDMSDDSDSTADDDDEQVEYLDDFGRTRIGTKKQVKQQARKARIKAIATEEAQHFAAHPQAPASVIYGDAIQHQAFNPDKTIAEQMAELAKKRDRSATPPPDTHFDASAEVRTKGTGFYTFSQDADERRKEMEALQKSREETEQARKEKEHLHKRVNSSDAATAQSTVVDEKAKADANKFLDQLELPLG